MHTKLCQLLFLAAFAACISADIHPPNFRPVGPRGPPPHLVKRPFRGPPRPPHGHPKFRPLPVHLGRAPSINRPFKVAPPASRPKVAPVKQFSPSPPAGPAHFVQPVVQNNNDVIHTIPAPNLGPNSGIVSAPPALFNSVATPIVPAVNTVDHGYKVYEDNSKNAFGLSYYAPDPDPSRPVPQVPVTSDPFSKPSISRTPLDMLIQQQFEASVPHVVKVNAPKSHMAHHKEAVANTTSIFGDTNSRFLQAFQDKYQKFDVQEQTSSKVKNDIDYDSGAEVRYSFGPAPAATHEEDDTGSEFYDELESEEKDEILEESDSMEFGARLKPKN